MRIYLKLLTDDDIRRLRRQGRLFVLTCITMWKSETTAKGNFVYISLLKQQGNSDFDFISDSFSAIRVSYIRYKHIISLKSYALKKKCFFFFMLAVSKYKIVQYKKNTFWFVFIVSYY